MGYGYDGFDEDEDEQDQRGDGPQGLRAHLKNLEKQVKELNKQLSEKDKTISELSTKTRGATLADILRSKGVNPKISGLIPASVEATEDEVIKWLDEYKDVLPLEKKTTVDPAAQKREPAADGDQLLPDERLALEQDDEDDAEEAELRQGYLDAQRALHGAQPGGQRQDVSSKLSEISDSAQSFDEAVEALKQVPGFKVAGFMS